MELKFSSGTPGNPLLGVSGLEQGREVGDVLADGVGVEVHGPVLEGEGLVLDLGVGELGLGHVHILEMEVGALGLDLRVGELGGLEVDRLKLG